MPGSPQSPITLHSTQNCYFWYVIPVGRHVLVFFLKNHINHMLKTHGASLCRLSHFLFVVHISRLGCNKPLS